MLGGYAQSTTLLQVVRDELNDQGVGRTDLRFALDGGGELLITTKQDGFIRRLVGSTGAGPGRTPTTMTIARLSSRMAWSYSAQSGWSSPEEAVYASRRANRSSSGPVLSADIIWARPSSTTKGRQFSWDTKRVQRGSRLKFFSLTRSSVTVKAIPSRMEPQLIMLI